MHSIAGPKGFVVQQLTHKLFSSSRNSHLSAAYAMYQSYDFFKNNKPNSLAAFGIIILNFDFTP